MKQKAMRNLEAGAVLVGSIAAYVLVPHEVLTPILALVGLAAFIILVVEYAD